MLLIGLPGPELGGEEREWLAQPEVSGVILFSRNVRDRDQLRGLNAAIREAAGRPVLIAVDQEGGPVQRLRGEGFTDLPPLAAIGALHRRDPASARLAARLHARVMAHEVRAAGFDLSLAPVADLGRGNRAIGTRAFSPDPVVTAELVACYVEGMAEAGMAATLKHFPGHGSVPEDTHDELACDPRPRSDWEEGDWLPFRAGIAAGARAVMMAHVVCPAWGERPAGAEPAIIGLLRAALGFSGLVMSDDLAMRGAAVLGGLRQRIDAHLEAGCELLLVCRPEDVGEAIALLRGHPPLPAERLPILRHGAGASAWDEHEHRASRVMLARLLNGEPLP